MRLALVSMKCSRLLDDCKLLVTEEQALCTLLSWKHTGRLFQRSTCRIGSARIPLALERMKRRSWIWAENTLFQEIQGFEDRKWQQTLPRILSSFELRLVKLDRTFRKTIDFTMKERQWSWHRNLQALALMKLKLRFKSSAKSKMGLARSSDSKRKALITPFNQISSARKLQALASTTSMIISQKANTLLERSTLLRRYISSKEGTYRSVIATCRGSR